MTTPERQGNHRYGRDALTSVTVLKVKKTQLHRDSQVSNAVETEGLPSRIAAAF